MFYNSLEPLTHVLKKKLSMTLVKNTVKKTLFKTDFCSGGFAVEGRDWVQLQIHQEQVEIYS